MQNISRQTCQKFRDARRALGLTQSRVADEIGCHQAALSMFERGMTTKLSADYVNRLAGLLRIDLKEIGKEESAGSAIATESCVAEPGFCPEPGCPSNAMYSVAGRTLFRVTLQKGIFCAHCGEVLEKRCPSCGAPLNEGACCSMCGSQYVKQ